MKLVATIRFLCAVALVSSIVDVISSELRQSLASRELIIRSMACMEQHIWTLSFDEICPIISSANCGTVRAENAIECVGLKIRSLTDQQIFDFLRSIVPTFNKYVEILNCTKVSLESICSRLCIIQNANLCPNNQLDLYALISYAQNNDIASQCI